MLICLTAAVGTQLKYYIDNPVPAERALINETKQFWVGMVSISAIITFFILCITISTIKKVNLTIKFLGEATKAVAKIPQTLALPLFTAFCTILIWFWFISGAAAIQSLTRPFYKVAVNGTKDVTGASDDCDIVEWQNPGHIEFTTTDKTCVFFKEEIVYGGMKGFPLPILQIMHIFGLYWFVNIIVNVGMFVLSGTFSQWYWTQRDDFKDLAKNPVCLSKLIFYATFGSGRKRHMDS